MPIATVNPATGQTLATFDALTPHALEQRLATTAAAAREWRRTPLVERARVVARAGAILDEDQDALGRLITTEMGKPIAAARAEVAKCASACRYYAEHAEQFLSPETVTRDGEHGYITYEPLGAVLAIMPWNFPFWQVVRFAAPALVAGNVGVLKHASNVPQSALALEDVFSRAGAPSGVFQTLLIETAQVADVIADPRIAAVTLTGSERAGSKVAATAGEYIKKTVLELGGSDPFVVMPSADLEAAVETAVTARTINNGQSCIAAKRFIVHRDVYEPFTERFVGRMERLRVGDPMDGSTQLGPLGSQQIVEDLDIQVQTTVAAGARLLTGGKRLDRPGFYYAATVLADIPRNAPAYHEELFGPVASVFRARDADEAIAIANDTSFGLGAAAWTGDRSEAERFARELAAGSVFINGMVASDPRFPFGGIKASGYGRELSAIGMREFVNIKTVRVKLP